MMEVSNKIEVSQIIIGIIKRERLHKSDALKNLHGCLTEAKKRLFHYAPFVNRQMYSLFVSVMLFLYDA